MDGVAGASKKVGGLAILAEFGKMLGDKMSVTKAAFANVAGDSGERNDDGRTLRGWKDSIQNLGERPSEVANGMKLKIVD